MLSCVLWLNEEKEHNKKGRYKRRYKIILDMCERDSVCRLCKRERERERGEKREKCISISLTYMICWIACKCATSLFFRSLLKLTDNSVSRFLQILPYPYRVAQSTNILLTICVLLKEISHKELIHFQSTSTKYLHRSRFIYIYIYKYIW